MYFCIGLSSTRTISSLFDGIPTKTSDFRRRNMWGPRRVCKRWIWSSFEISANSRVKSSKSLNAHYILFFDILKLLQLTENDPDWESSKDGTILPSYSAMGFRSATGGSQCWIRAVFGRKGIDCFLDDAPRQQSERPNQCWTELLCLCWPTEWNGMPTIKRD